MRPHEQSLLERARDLALATEAVDEQQDHKQRDAGAVQCVGTSVAAGLPGHALDASHPEGCAVMKHGGPVLSTGLPSAPFERMQVHYAVWGRRRGSPKVE
jgi:hypothetical protein